MALDPGLAQKIRSGFASAGPEAADLVQQRLARAKYTVDVVRELHGVCTRLFGCDERSSLALVLQEAEAHFLWERWAARAPRPVGID